MLRFLIILLIIFLYRILNLSEEYTHPICIALTLIFGIPHGAVDHKILKLKYRRRKVAEHHIKYLAIMISYLCIWFFMPSLAIIIFLITSALHFAQEFLEEISYKNVKWTDMLMVGTLIILIPILISYQEIIPFIEIASKGSLSTLIPLNIPKVYPYTILICILGILIYKRLHWQINNRQLYRLILMMSCVLISYNLLPFTVAFTIYFLLFHTINSFKHQYQWFQKVYQNYSIGKFCKDLCAMSIPVILLALIFTIFFGVPSWDEYFTIFFIGISIISLPHAIVFDLFYKLRKQQAEYS